MTTRTGERIPLGDLEGIITRALQPGDYEHDTAWIDGGPVQVPTPAAHIMTAGILISALPGPGPDGTLDAHEAALSVLSVIEERLAGPYILRAFSLRDRLAEESEIYETAHGAPDASPVPASAPRCQVCSKPLKPGSKASRRTCGDNCRQKLRQRRLRASRQSPGTREGVSRQ